MQGLIWGSVNEVFTGKTVMDQVFQQTSDGHYDIVPEAVLFFIGIVALVTFGTTVTTLNPHDKLTEESMKYNISSFTADAELVNGRTAMIGFAILSAFKMLT